MPSKVSILRVLERKETGIFEIWAHQIGLMGSRRVRMNYSAAIMNSCKSHGCNLVVANFVAVIFVIVASWLDWFWPILTPSSQIDSRKSNGSDNRWAGTGGSYMDHTIWFSTISKASIRRDFPAKFTASVHWFNLYRQRMLTDDSSANAGRESTWLVAWWIASWITPGRAKFRSKMSLKATVLLLTICRPTWAHQIGWLL